MTDRRWGPTLNFNGRNEVNLNHRFWRVLALSLAAAALGRRRVGMGLALLSLTWLLGFAYLLLS